MNWLAIIRAIAPKGKASIVQGMATAMPGLVSEFAISTPLRQAHFLAQLAHESDGFRTTVEYASGAAYEGRRDLGNTVTGDGKRFKGRGLIQLTGRANYESASRALGVDLIANPDEAARFPVAARAAGWFWSTRRLNALADKDDVRAITKRINGGFNGLEDRKGYLARAKAVLSKPPIEAKPEAPVTNDKPLAKSRTMAGAGTAAIGGVIVAVQEGQKALESAQGQITTGTWIGVAIGGLIIIGAGLALYARWDDAGRPLPWRS